MAGLLLSARARAARPSLGSSVKKNTLLSASRPTLGVQGTLGVQNSLGTSASAGVVSGQNNGGVLGGIGYLGHKLGLGVLSTLEGIWDYSAGGIAKLFGADEWAEEQFKDDWVNYNSADEWYDPSEGWKFAGDVASGIGTSAVSIGAAFIPVVGPAVSIAVAGLGAAGNATKEAYRQTGKLGGKEFAYGALVGGTEAVLEAVTGKIGAGSQRIATEIAEKMGRSTAKEVTKTVAKNSAKQIAGQLAKDFAGEAFEEGMAEILSPFFKNVTYSEGEKIDWKSVGYNALVGGISGVVMGGSQQAVNTTKNYFSGKSAVKNGTADGILREAKNIWEIERGADASLGTTGSDAERGTGIAAFEAVKSTYEKLQESLKATGGELKTANQMMMLGSLKEQNVAARLSIFVEKSAKRLVENADSFAARSVEFGMKDADGNPVSIDAAKITEGVDRSDLNSKAGYKRYIKSLRRAMVNNATLGQLAVADATGHLLLDTQKFAAAEQRALKMADATDLNRFLERADEKEKAALAERLGIEDFNMLSHESFRAAVAEMAEDGDVMRDFAKQNARVKRAVSAKNAAVLPETVTSDLADGVYRTNVQGNGLSVLKEGENFFVVEPTTRKISCALDAEELTSVLQDARGEVAAEGRLAIGRTVENKPFVEIENDILDGVPESDWIKTVKSNLAAKFPNGIKLGKNTVKINLTTRREMTFSKYMQWLKANDPQAFSDKLRATDNVDEILQATTGWINEGLNHPRSDSVTDFARGTVLIKVGQHDYSADVVVGSAQDGSMLMYDIINLQPTTITKKETSSVITGDPSREASRKALHLSDTSITENAEKSNSFAEKNSANDANSDTSANLEGERREQAPALQRNAETESEQTAEDNGKARREAIAIDVWARENIPDYAGLNAPARAAVRATVRNARAHGIAESDVKTYARVAARSGLNISFDVAKAAGGDARYDTRNTVYVSPSAPAERIQRGLLLHEGGHALFFKTKSGKKLLARAVEMADAETAAEVRKQYTEYYEKQNVDKSVYEPIIEEEIAAAGLEKALGVDGAWEFILAEQPTLGERFLSFFRGAARDYAGVGELSAEARKLLRTYQKAFAELAAYNQGNNALTGMNGEKTQVSETKKAADGAERFALSGQKTPTYEELVAKSPIKIVDVKKGIESDSYANMKSAVSEKAKQEGWFDAPHHNKDTDGLIFLTEKSFTHAYSNLSTAFGEDTIRCMAHIPEIINEAVLVSVDDPRDNRKSETKVYTFFGAIDGVGGLEPVKLTVKEYGFRTIKDVPKNIRAYFEKNGVMESYNSLYDTHALEVIGVEGIKKESDASGKVGAQGARARATSDSTISIANLLDLVKGDAEKYIPKASTNFQTDGDLQGRLALPKDTKSQATGKTGQDTTGKAQNSTRKSADTITMSKGQFAKLKANYHGEKVFDKQKIKDALMDIECVERLKPATLNRLVDQLWKGFNGRLGASGYLLQGDIMRDTIHTAIVEEAGDYLLDQEYRFKEPALINLETQITDALERIIREGRPSKAAKQKAYTDKLREQANYSREEHSRVVERNNHFGRVPKMSAGGKQSYTFAEVAREKLTAEEIADFQGTLEKKVGADRTKYKAKAKDFVFTRAASVYIDTVDELYGISHFLKNAGGVRDAAAVVNVARSSISQAQTMIGHMQYDLFAEKPKKLGKGLQKILAPVMPQIKAFNNYLLNYHNVDRMSLEERSSAQQIGLAERVDTVSKKIKILEKNGKKVPDEMRAELKAAKEALAAFVPMKNKPLFDRDGEIVTAKQSENLIAEYEHTHPEFKQVAEEIWAFFRNLNQMRVDAGLISQTDFNRMQELYPHYVPAYRDVVDHGKQSEAKTLAVNKTVKRAVGGTPVIVDILRAGAEQVQATVRAAQINRIAAAIADAAQHSGSKAYVEIVSREKSSRTEERETDAGGLELRPKDNQIIFFRNGEKITMQVSDEIFKGFEGLYQPTVELESMIFRTMNRINNGFKKLVTSWSPAFAIRNPIRDLQDAGINSRHPALFAKNLPIAVRTIARNGELWQQYCAMGGFSASVFGADGIKAAVGEHGFETLLSLINKNDGKINIKEVLKVVPRAGKNVLTLVENVNAFVEQIPRFAEYLASVEAGESVAVALNNSAEVTTNFGRRGRLTKKLNATIMPFLNPAIQGFDKIFRNVKDAVTGEELAKGIAALVSKLVLIGILPTVLNALLYEDDEDYQMLDEAQKENSFLFKVGDVFVKIPRGRVASVIGGAANRIRKSAKGEDADWGGYFSNAVSQVTPVENMTRSIFAPILWDLPTNTTWYGSAIEGRQFENTAPRDRYDESTSKIAIWLGQRFNYSPKKIHYLLDQYSGVIGDFVLPATTSKAEKGFFSGNFTIDPVPSNKLSDEFYELLEEAQYAKTAGDDTAIYQVRYFNRTKDAINKMYDEISKIQQSDLSDAEKLQQTRVIRVLINEAYKTAMQDYALFTEAVNATNMLSVDAIADGEGMSEQTMRNLRFTEASRLVYGSKYALEVWDESVYAKATMLNGAGVSYDTYYNYYFTLRGISSDKDKNGDVVAGSKRRKVVAAISGLGVSTEQRLLLICASGYALKDGDVRGLTAAAAKKRLLRYILSHRGMSAAEKAEIAEMCGFEVKNGRIRASSVK